MNTQKVTTQIAVIRIMLPLVFIAVTPLARHRAWHRDRCKYAAATASPCRARAVGGALVHFLVALVPERDLLFCAKHLFVAAKQWGESLMDGPVMLD